MLPVESSVLGKIIPAVLPKEIIDESRIASQNWTRERVGITEKRRLSPEIHSFDFHFVRAVFNLLKNKWLYNDNKSFSGNAVCR
jgi:hypothetical protein